MMIRILMVCGAILASCGTDTEIEFRICGDLKVPKQLDALRISVLDDTLEEKNFALIELVPREVRADGGSAGAGGKSSSKDAGTRSAKDSGVASSSASSSVEKLPITASLPARVDSGYVRVQALLQGEEVARFDRRIPNMSKAKSVDMPLTNSCYGQTNCARGQTCLEDECAVAPLSNDSPHCN
jgi:hypothetical protein